MSEVAEMPNELWRKNFDTTGLPRCGGKANTAIRATVAGFALIAGFVAPCVCSGTEGDQGLGNVGQDTSPVG